MMHLHLDKANFFLHFSDKFLNFSVSVLISFTNSIVPYNTIK